MNIPPKPLILVVDDEPANLDVVSDVLSGNGYEVRTAANLNQARKALDEFAPNLLILDRNLPDGDGLDLCREIRLGSRNPGLPVLILTVRNETAEVVRGLSLGADDYLPKPFGSEELEARVMAILRRATRHRHSPKQAASTPAPKRPARRTRTRK